MNKTQLVDALAERLGDRRAAATALEGLLETIVDTVRSGDSVSLTGFGVFEGRARAARTARNPRTGEAVDVPATTVPAFRPGAAFRSAVGGGGAPAPRSAPTRSRATAAAAEPETAPEQKTPARRNAAAPKTAPEPAPETSTQTAKVGSSFAVPAEQPGKPEKQGKSGKSGKSEKTGKSEKSDKSEKSEKKAGDKGKKKAKGKK